jgi:hypothetical protein
MKGMHQEDKARRAREHGVPVNNASCVVEYRTKLEVGAAQMREGLIAFEQGYDLLNVLSLSPLAQETYWKLRNEKEV